MAGDSLPVLHSFQESFNSAQYLLVLHNIYFCILAAAKAFFFYPARVAEIVSFVRGVCSKNKY